MAATRYSNLVFYSLSHMVEAVFGFLLAVIGIALCATFWLLPVGLPLALVGVALMEAAGEAH